MATQRKETQTNASSSTTSSTQCRFQITGLYYELRDRPGPCIENNLDHFSEHLEFEVLRHCSGSQLISSFVLGLQARVGELLGEHPAEISESERASGIFSGTTGPRHTSDGLKNDMPPGAN